MPLEGDSTLDRQVKDKFQNRYMYLLIGLICILVFVLIVVNIMQMEKLDKYKAFIKNTYEKEFHLAVEYINDINLLMNKYALLNENSEEIKITYANLWSKSGDAHNSISSLPYSTEDVEKILTCLSQTSDLAYTLFIKSINGEPIKQGERDNLKDLGKYIYDLSNEINRQAIEQDLQGGGHWEELSLANQKDVEILGSISNISKQFIDYPTLSYDGPFSHATLNKEPAMLEGKSYVNEEEAKKQGEAFFSDIRDVKLIGESNIYTNGQIPTYSFSAKKDKYDKYPTVFFDISKRGGYVVYMLCTKDIQGYKKMDTQELISKGKGFLVDKGFGEMECSYYEIYEDTITINYASKIGDVVVYPDSIKLKLNLYTGDIVGFEGIEYLENHKNRNFVEVKFSSKNLQKKLSKDYEVYSVEKVLISTDRNKEALCFEYKGKIDDICYLTYINVETGFIEEIYQLDINDYGIFAN